MVAFHYALPEAKRPAATWLTAITTSSATTKTRYDDLKFPAAAAEIRHFYRRIMQGTHGRTTAWVLKDEHSGVTA